MGLMRKLMMGCASDGVRTLVNTTEPHTSPELMNTPITLTVGASYSVSWAGTIPSSNDNPYYLFNILGGPTNTGMCYAKITKDSLRRRLSIELLDTLLYSQTAHVGDSIALELRFKVNTVSTSSPYYTMDVELYVNGTQKVIGTESGKINAGADGLHHYSNAAGTFIIKKLS